VSSPLAGAPQVYRDVPLEIDPAEVLRFQGYKQDTDVPTADVRALFDEALAEGRRLMAPRAVLRWLPVASREAGALTVGDVRLTIPGIAERWGAVEHVVAAVCTIGDALERRVSALWESRELPLAMMLDSVGSGAVESLAEYVNDLACADGLVHDLKVTNRISPGYGDWDVAEQRALFALCAGDPVGVTLNASCFMTPTKSISLLAGAGPTARVDHYFSQCARCWMQTCAYRRTPARATIRRK
jgi:Vitamin B12 dependent methionine synthase, activation domain